MNKSGRYENWVQNKRMTVTRTDSSKQGGTNFSITGSNSNRSKEQGSKHKILTNSFKKYR